MPELYLDACCELIKVEWLGEVVVCTELEQLTRSAVEVLADMTITGSAESIPRTLSMICSPVAPGSMRSHMTRS